MAVIKANYESKSYDVVVNRTALDKLRFYINTNRDVLVITDENVAEHYLKRVTSQFTRPHHIVVKAGEVSKSLAVYQEIIEFMIDKDLGKDVLVIALGGGVVGDLAGYVAATYMRGVELLMLPTSTLAMVDSSIGGKVALNIDGVKNVIGAFYQPSKVLIDPDVLETLSDYDYNSGLAEALKAGMIGDATLVDIMLEADIKENIEDIITKSLDVKNKIVMQDEKETRARMLLNYGHTLGHALEASSGLDTMSHGECVMLGMILEAETAEEKEVLVRVAQKLNLKSSVDIDHDRIETFVRHDKKLKGDAITITKLKEIGGGYLETVNVEEFLKKVTHIE